MVTKGEMWWRDKSEAWDEHTHTTIYKTESTRTSCIAQVTLLNIV